MTKREILIQLQYQEAFFNRVLTDSLNLKRAIEEGKIPFLGYSEELKLLEEKINHIQLLLKDIHIEIWRVSYE